MNVKQPPVAFGFIKHSSTEYKYRWVEVWIIIYNINYKYWYSLSSVNFEPDSKHISTWLFCTTGNCKPLLCWNLFTLFISHHFLFNCMQKNFHVKLFAHFHSFEKNSMDKEKKVSNSISLLSITIDFCINNLFRCIENSITVRCDAKIVDSKNRQRYKMCTHRKGQQKQQRQHDSHVYSQPFIF